MINDTNTNKKARASHLRWVPIEKMKVSPKAQREFRLSHAEEYAADFDLEALGFPVVNLRDGVYYIVDGSHRVGALRLIGWGDQQIQCECYEGLTEAEEAELFLKRDKRRAIRTFDKFRIANVAGREVETDITRIVLTLELKIANNQNDGTSIAAVSALERVYRQAGPAVLTRTLKVIRDGFAGDVSAFKGEIIRGIGLICQRYNGDLPDERLISALASLRGGASALLRRAEGPRRQMGVDKANAIAGTVIEMVNAGRGGKKVKDWWK